LRKLQPGGYSETHYQYVVQSGQYEFIAVGRDRWTAAVGGEVHPAPPSRTAIGEFAVPLGRISEIPDKTATGHGWKGVLSGNK
jgi:hypothetical protein